MEQLYPNGKNQLNLFLEWKNNDSQDEYYLIYKEPEYIDIEEEGEGILIRKDKFNNLELLGYHNRDSELIFSLDIFMNDSTTITYCKDVGLLENYIDYFREMYDEDEEENSYESLEKAIKKYEQEILKELCGKN